MSLSRNVVSFQPGETLTPTRLNRAWERLYKDMAQSTAKRLNRFPVRFDWTGLTNASTAEEFIFRIKAPWAYRVEYVEFVLFNATGTVTSVQFSTTLVNAQTVTVAPAGATTRALASAVMVASAAANTEIQFSIAVSAPAGYTLGRCYAIVHFVADRGNAGLSYTAPTVADAPRFASGETVDAAKLNTAFATYETTSTRNTAADRNLRIVLFSLRSIASPILASDADMRLPADANRIDSMDVVNLGSATNDVTGHVQSGGRVDVATATAAGSAFPPSKTQGHAVTNTQGSAPTAAGNDYFVAISRVGAGTIPLAYVVVYCS